MNCEITFVKRFKRGIMACTVQKKTTSFYTVRATVEPKCIRRVRDRDEGGE